jgi:hypothetical protein
MRRSLLVLAAGLAGALAVTGCDSNKSSSGGTPPKGDPAVGARGGAPAGGPEGKVVTPPPPAGPADTGPDSSFELATQQPGAVAATAPATARLVVHPGPGLKMNLDYPTGLTLTPPAGVSLAKTSFAATDAEKFDAKELSYAVSLTGAAAGEYKVPGTFKFAVCDEGACYPKKRAVEILLTVQ